MSTKRPRVPPPEAIITRHKSAQLKRQLRNKEASILKISQMTQLLLSPSQKKSPVKKPSPRKRKMKDTIQEKLKRLREVAQLTEYLPNTKKRALDNKKILLKPNNEYKTIGSKRKAAVPHKGIQSPVRQPADLSMEDLILQASLDDEDLMEILTCPSPVWWEEPPDDYDEEPLCTMNSEDLPVPEESKPADTHTDKITIIDETESKTLEKKQKDDVFLKKRGKLQNLLDNIYNKGNIKQIVENRNNQEDKSVNEGENSQSSDTSFDKAKTLSESTEDDGLASLRDEDMLNDLENMDIPIKQADAVSIDSTDSIETESNDNKKDLDDDENKDLNIDNNKNLNDHVSKLRIEKIEKDNSSPVSIESDANREKDSISDSNIQFIYEEDCNQKDLICKEIEKEKNELTAIELEERRNNLKRRLSQINVDHVIGAFKKRRKEKMESKKTYQKHLNKPRDVLIFEQRLQKIDPDFNAKKETTPSTSKHEPTRERPFHLKVVSTRQPIQTQETNIKSNIMNAYKDICKSKFQLEIDNDEMYVNKTVTKDRMHMFYRKYKKSYHRQVNNVNVNVKIDNVKYAVLKVRNQEIEMEAQNQIKMEAQQEIQMETNQEIDTDSNAVKPKEPCGKCETAAKKSIEIRNSDKVKYCLNCSSIFDSDDCAYCKNKNSIVKDCSCKAVLE